MNKNNTNVEETARAFLLNAELTDAQIAALEQIGYFTAPASMKHHLNKPGGLAEHSVNVARQILALRAFSKPATAYKVGMLHDLVKCKCYAPSKKGSGYTFVKSGLPGHGVTSAILCAQCGIRLSEEELVSIIWHMGPFAMSEDDMKEYQSAVFKFPRQIILTHAADHLASVYESLSTLPNEEADDADIA